MLPSFIWWASFLISVALRIWTFKVLAIWRSSLKTSLAVGLIPWVHASAETKARGLSTEVSLGTPMWPRFCIYFSSHLWKDLTFMPAQWWILKVFLNSILIFSLFLSRGLFRRSHLPAPLVTEVSPLFLIPVLFPKPRESEGCQGTS